jgi:protein-L-isoaspartate(D-aspartate) O-methyltransferase
VYHNLAIAIDPGRQLFNGAPGLLAMAIDVLALEAGQRVLHVGCGTGYYTAVMARCVGASGHVVAIDADEALAARAKANLVSMPWVAVRHGDASGPFDETFDAILINAGMTHPLPVWLDALEAGGRMVIPLTVLTAPPIGKGPMFLFTRTADPARLDARTVSFVAIYSAIGVRDDALNAKLGDALRTNPFPAVRHLRRDPHDPGASCWFHGFTSCLSLE